MFSMRYFVFFLSFLFSFNVWAEDWSNSAEWLAIGHYQDQKSSIDSPNFFLSKDGKTNPKAELEATINLFNSDDNKLKCQFPARYLFLKKHKLITAKFPKCEEFEEFKHDLQPAGVTLLFTDAYMNNPSSLFGHTLIRIDTKRKGTQMLAHGANYGAFTGENPGPLYALFGLTGRYFGGFTVKPYYDIINTYNNIENRDIWELNLDLTQEELNFFVAHLWEIGQTQSRYYFFSKNCSYMLLEMLDAVRPSLKLASKFPVQVIPLDSFKAVFRSKDFVKDINYRPSRQKQIVEAVADMNDVQKKAYFKGLREKKYDLPENLSEDEKSDILGTAYQFVQYQYVAKKLELADYRKQSFEILRQRSKLKTTKKNKKIKGKSPLESHESMRLSAGIGAKNGNVFEEIAYRPAYHSLTDNDFGLLKGAEINFLETKLRHYNQDNKTVLQNFDLLTIRSISPADEMFNPLSFQIKANIERWTDAVSKKEGYIGNLMIGTGKAYAFSDNIWGFAFWNNKASTGGFLPHNSMLSFGLNTGVLLDFDKWKGLLEVTPWLASQKIGNMTSYRAELNYVIDTNVSVSAEALFEDRYGKDENEFLLKMRYFF